jgi:hypothetical protein
LQWRWWLDYHLSRQPLGGVEFSIALAASPVAISAPPASRVLPSIFFGFAKPKEKGSSPIGSWRLGCNDEVALCGSSVGHGHILSQKSGNKKVFLRIFNLFFLIKSVDMKRDYTMTKTIVSRW